MLLVTGSMVISNRRRANYNAFSSSAGYRDEMKMRKENSLSSKWQAILDTK
jgi:hypothetical protein